MREVAIRLADIFETGAFEDGTVPKVLVIDAVHDEVLEAVGLDSAHNLETYWFMTYEDEYGRPPEVSIRELAESIEDFREVDHYQIWVSYSADEGLWDGDKVVDASYDGERLMLFVNPE